jgi:UDP-glucuronate 4-epimerase
MGRKAEKIMRPQQLGDVPNTYANVDELIADVGYKPDTPIEVGVRNFVEWFREYYGYTTR